MCNTGDLTSLHVYIQGRPYTLKKFSVPPEDRGGESFYDCDFYETLDEKIIIKNYRTSFSEKDSAADREKKCKKYLQYVRCFQNEYMVMRQIRNGDAGELFPAYFDYYPRETPENTLFPESGRLGTWIAMEKINGPSLERYLSKAGSRQTGQRFQRNLLTREQRYIIMEQAFRAVKALYDQDLFYLDLNPSNLIIENEEQMALRFIDMTSCKRKGCSSDIYPFKYISAAVKIYTTYNKNSDTEVRFTEKQYIKDGYIDILLVKCFRELYMRLFYPGKNAFASAVIHEFSRTQRSTVKNPFMHDCFRSLLVNQFVLSPSGLSQIDRDEAALESQRKSQKFTPLFELWFRELEKFYANDRL